MTTVGIRDLKNQLSRYLDIVKGGEKVLVTEHNKIIAQISLPREDPLSPSVEDRLAQLENEGKVIRAKRNQSLAQSPPSTPTVDWKPILQDIRSDRFE
jgi:antitoxin (DNA-binding transcriptional repressor) of toxin-antitoxin stability system